MAGSSNASAGDLPGRIAELAEPFASEHGLELIDVEVKGQGNRRVVRLIADADGGLEVDRIAELSKSVGELLDEKDVVKGSYTLEVSSPGTDRPLKTRRDFARNVGRDVRIVRTKDAAMQPDKKGEMTGKVIAATDDAVTLEVKGDETVVPLDEIDFGKVVLPW